MYISSGYFPSTAKKTTCYFVEDLTLHWHHFQYLSPSTSVIKYVECLEEVTKARGGVCYGLKMKVEYLLIIDCLIQTGIINRTHFSRVGKELEFFRHRTLTAVLSCKILFCEACRQENLTVHIDGNFKLYRWMNSAQYASYKNYRILFSFS